MARGSSDFGERMMAIRAAKAAAQASKGDDFLDITGENAPDVHTGQSIKAARAAGAAIAAKAKLDNAGVAMSDAELEAWAKQFEDKVGTDSVNLRTAINPKYKDDRFDYIWGLGSSAAVQNMLDKGWKIVENAELAKEKGNHISSLVKIPSSTGASSGEDKDSLFLFYRPKILSEKARQAFTSRLKELNPLGAGSAESLAKEEISISQVDIDIS
ncbi:hypothetical protein FACS1894186_4830 [Alphaproteobacteria bacterium]|nr:hypothetical protein FACS1894186_4830 [Alphaproteobacteria bacterium]